MTSIDALTVSLRRLLCQAGTRFASLPYSRLSYSLHVSILGVRHTDHFAGFAADALFNRFFSGGNNTTFRFSSNTTGTPPPNTTSIHKDVLDAFTLLGLSPTASVDDIKKAYRAKALVTHPDHGGGHADMAKLNQAKEVALGHAER